jgi:hypothetical protein
MRNSLKTLAVLASVFSLVPVASAGVFTPSGGTLAATADIEVRKLLTLNCALTAPISSNGVITASTATTGTYVDSISLSGDSSCSAVSFVSTNMPVTTVSATQVRINNIVVNGLTGNCAGSLLATVTPTGILQFSHSNTIPSTSGIGNCSVGSKSATPVVTTPAASYTYP